MTSQSESEFEQLLMILADYHTHPDSAAERSESLKKLFPWQRSSDMPSAGPAAELLPAYAASTESMQLTAEGNAIGGYVATA